MSARAMPTPEGIVPEFGRRGGRAQLHVGVLITLHALGALLVCARASAREFTVRDSIEMTTFSDPSQIYGNGRAEPSPDGRYYAIVTTRGLLITNQVESAIWLFNTSSLAHYADGAGFGAGIAPQRIATLRAQPLRQADGPYEAVISGLRWATDSKSLYFLGQGARGIRHLYQASLTGAHPLLLSGRSSDVWRYDATRSAIVYLATEDSDRCSASERIPGNPINPDASSITGLPIGQVLFPSQVAHPEKAELWVIHRGRRRRVETSVPFPAELEAPWNAFAISPDGARVVLLTGIDRIEPSWRAFIPATGFEGHRIGSAKFQSISPYNPFRLRQYTVVNLRSGKVEFLENAPYGIFLGYQDRLGARWSKDSEHLLLGNTFLPLPSDDLAIHDARLRPCSAVYLDLGTNHQQCIAATRDDTEPTPANPAPLRLKDFAFADSSDRILLTFARPEEKDQVETYAMGDGAPRLVPNLKNLSSLRTGSDSSPDNDLRVEIRQGLNTPPTLWAVHVATGKGREVWDPNPQLGEVTFGKVSIYRWKDASGYEWTGGLILPVGYLPGKRYPLVIQTHGFRKGQFLTDGEYPTAMAAQPLANAGIAVLQMGGRGDHMLSWQEALDQVEGYTSAVGQLDADGIVDAHKVGIIGFSRTCWYAETALSSHPNLFAAATLADGIDYSYMDYLLFPEHVAAESDRVHGGSPFGKARVSWIRSSPDSHLESVRAAVRIEAIRPLSVLGRWELYSTLRLEGKAVDFIYIPNGQHILQRPLDRMASQQGDVDWFRFWLQGHEDPVRSKRDQYRRWEELRAMNPIKH